jgi:hypothetical protein
MVKKSIVILYFFFLTITSNSQNIISYISINKTDAYIGEPVQLTVSVYSSTWFTSGIDIGNIQIDNALTVYFRSVSNSREFSGKKYAGVNFYYNVFPTKEGKITIPSLSIDVESPKPGDYKGLKRTVKTKPKHFNVKGIPLGYYPNNWLVSNYLNVRETWSMPLNNIKVGDVVQRTINRSAGGTLSEFIPASIWDSISTVGIYPKRASVNTNKSKTAVSANRSETINYLFEKEGRVIIPSIKYVYWNPQTKNFYKKQTDSIVVNVKPNTDLEMLASIKKSLQKTVSEANISEEKPFLIFGLTPKRFIKYLIFTLLIGFILFRGIKTLIPILKRKLENYKKSEYYAFKQVKKTLKLKDYNAFLLAIHSWIKKLNPKLQSLHDLPNNNEKALTDVLNSINDVAFKQELAISDILYTKLLNTLTESRKTYLKRYNTKRRTIYKSKKWLNPFSDL